MSIDARRYVDVLAAGAPNGTQAETDLAAATAAGAIAGDEAGRAAGRAAGLEAGTEVASEAGAAAGADAGAIAGAQAGQGAGATAGAAAGAAAAGVVVAGKADKTTTISGGGLASGGGSLAADRVITVTAATQAEAETGAATTVAMTPQRTTQHFGARTTAYTRSLLLTGALAPFLLALGQIPATALDFTQVGAASAKNVQGKLEKLLYVTDFPGVDGLGGDQTVGLLQAHAALNTYCLLGYAARLVYPGGYYKTTSALPVPDARDWEIEGHGQPTIEQQTANTPIFPLTATATRSAWKIRGFVFQYAVTPSITWGGAGNAVPSGDVRSVAIEINATGNLPDGVYDFDVSDNRFENCFRGIAVGEPSIAAAYNFPTWGWQADRVRSFTGMKGATLKLGNYGSSGGAPRGIASNLHIQCPNAGEPAVYISKMSSPVLIAPEILRGVNRVIYFASCVNETLISPRLELCSVTANGADSITRDGVGVGTIVGVLDVQTHTFATGGGNSGYILNAFQGSWRVGGFLGRDFTLTSGTAVGFNTGGGGRIVLDGPTTLTSTGAFRLYQPSNGVNIGINAPDTFTFYQGLLAASLSFVPIEASGSTTKKYIMPRPGFVVGLIVNLSATPTLDQAQFFVKKNGTTLNGTSVVLTPGETVDKAYLVAGNDPNDGTNHYFSAGDALQVIAVTGATFAPTPNVDATVLVAYL